MSADSPRRIGIPPEGDLVRAPVGSWDGSYNWRSPREISRAVMRPRGRDAAAAVEHTRVNDGEFVRAAPRLRHILELARRHAPTAAAYALAGLLAAVAAVGALYLLEPSGGSSSGSLGAGEPAQAAPAPDPTSDAQADLPTGPTTVDPTTLPASGETDPPGGAATADVGDPGDSPVANEAASREVLDRPASSRPSTAGPSSTPAPTPTPAPTGSAQPTTGPSDEPSPTSSPAPDGLLGTLVDVIRGVLG